MATKAKSSPPGCGPAVWLVEDCFNSPGKIYAIFASEEDAENFATFFEGAKVIKRTLFYGQPPCCGYNL